MKPLLCALLIALLLVTPVAATMQYPEEYYALGQQADSLTKVECQDAFSCNQPFSYYGGNGLGFYGTFLELRRQTILMEKQNELLQEQNELLRKIAPREETLPNGNYTFYYGGYGVDDPKYTYVDCTDAGCYQPITYEYCNALNTSQCWKNASEIPSGYLP